MIKPDPSLLVPAQKNTLTGAHTVRDMAAECEFRGKEIDRVNLNMKILREM